jgi:hypothetical protein
VAASLAWATHDGVDWLVLRGLSPDALAHLHARSPADLARVLPVLPSEVVDAVGIAGPLQAMPGRYAVAADEIRFAPRFAFLAGTSYAVILGLPVTADDQAVLRISRPPVGGTPSTEVAAVYPTTAGLPRNALRFYIHFSAPMSEGLAARHVHLERDDTGERISGAFSPMDFELWDPDRRRLTVLLDPARIKQGLTPHREAGYPLAEGIAVVLVVERGFYDAAGHPLVADRRQRYDIGPDVRSPVSPAGWMLEVPEAGGRRPLVARFDRPLDRALLEDCLNVVGSDGRAVPGVVDVAPGERSWAFVAEAPWAPGPHRLLVDPVLEDQAGNSVIRVFDRDLDRPEHEPRAVGAASIPFFVAGDRDNVAGDRDNVAAADREKSGQQRTLPPPDLSRRS